MALSLFDCANNTDYAVVTSTQTSIYTKTKLYDEALYSIINLYYNVIYGYATNFQNSDNPVLKDYAQYLIDKYNEYLNKQDYYKKFFTNLFNENLVNTSYKDIYTLIEKVNNIQIDYTANFPEYYLMVKQTEKYTCVYKKVFNRLMKFFSVYGIRGSIMCVFDQDINKFRDEVNELIDWIDTNNINTSLSYEEVQEQKLKNAYESYSQFTNYLSDLIYNIQDHSFDLKVLYLAIGSFMYEVKLALKTISLANIVLTASTDDLKYFDSMARTMLTYQPNVPLNTNLEKTSEMQYYNLKGMNVIQFGIPIFLRFRSYLKSDWSNFQQVLIPSVQVALPVCALYTYSMLLLNYLPVTDDE